MSVKRAVFLTVVSSSALPVILLGFNTVQGSQIPRCATTMDLTINIWTEATTSMKYQPQQYLKIYG